MGWNGTVLGRLMFGWESPESEDVPLGNIRMRFGFTPSPQISRTGAVPSGTRRSLAGVEEERRGKVRPWPASGAAAAAWVSSGLAAARASYGPAGAEEEVEGFHGSGHRC